MSLNPRITDWTGRVVWLVGASTGIGRATASLLHSRGARVIVSARTATALEGFVRAHPGSEAVALDVTDRQSLAQAATQVVARHGRIGFGEQIEIAQGEEIGRPSRLWARVQGTVDNVERVDVGGAGVIVARGEFRLR